MNKKKNINAGILAGIIVAVVVIIGVVVLLLVAPWKGQGDENNNTISDVKASYNTKGKCKFYECLNKVTGDSTKEEVEEAFGFEPKSDINESSKTEKYTWAFDPEHTIVMTVTTFSGKPITSSIRIDNYDYDDIEQKGVKFDNVKEIKANLNKGDGVSYEEFKEYMGGVDGVLIEVSSSKKYEWRSTDADGFMTGTFNSKGRCTFMNGATY